MKQKFKKGDKVVPHSKTLTADCSFKNFEDYKRGVADKVIVVDKYNDDGSIRCETSNGGWYFTENDLDLYVEPVVDKSVTNFKKGDKVKVVDFVDSPFNNKIGTIIGLLPRELSVSGNVGVYAVDIENPKGSVNICHECLELVEPEYMIGNNKVTFSAGDVKVGCLTVTNTKLEVIKELMEKGVVLTINGHVIDSKDVKYVQAMLKKRDLNQALYENLSN